MSTTSAQLPPLLGLQAARVVRLETMETARGACDTAEETVPAALWTLATYKEMLFLDSHQGADGAYD